MRKFVSGVLLLITLSVYSQNSLMENKNILRGEKLQYNIKYGWFKIGEAEVEVGKNFEIIDGEPHYVARFDLVTAGWAKFFASVHVEFKSYIHAKTFKPHHAYRGLSTSKKINNQHDKFFYKDSVYVETYREDKDKTKTTSYPIYGPTFTDAMGTYLYVRGLPLNLDKKESARFYIAGRVYDFSMTPNKAESGQNDKYYKLIFPPIKEFPPDKTSYAILNREKNIPKEIKLASNNGNFYFVLDEEEE